MLGKVPNLWARKSPKTYGRFKGKRAKQFLLDLLVWLFTERYELFMCRTEQFPCNATDFECFWEICSLELSVGKFDQDRLDKTREIGRHRSPIRPPWRVSSPEVVNWHRRRDTLKAEELEQEDEHSDEWRNISSLAWFIIFPTLLKFILIWFASAPLQVCNALLQLLKVHTLKSWRLTAKSTSKDLWRLPLH